MERIGKYTNLERIARGGMGTVYRAHDPLLNRTVALKAISSDIEVSADLKARFLREAQACARLSHPNIVTIYDLGDDKGQLYIVMELLEGQELKDLIEDRVAMTLPEKLSIMVQVCDGLAYAHEKGITHRDIKPANIFVTREGVPKIVDFGIARIAAADHGLTRTGVIMGTFRYLAPEQARGKADHRADMFSLGAVFFELLTYRPAFGGQEPMEILEQIRSEVPPALNELDPAIPADLGDIVARALEKDAAQRFSSLTEMRDALEVVRKRVASDPAYASVHEGVRTAFDRPSTQPTWATRQETRPGPRPTAHEATVMSDAPTVIAGAQAAPPRSATARSSTARHPRKLPILPIAIGAAALVAVVVGGVVFMKGRDATGSRAGVAAVRPITGAQARTAAEELRGKLSIARDEAARADAERVASQPFTSAREKEREGHAAFGASDFGAAQVRYGEAVRAYEEATAEARKGARLARDEGEARRALSVATDARRSAEGAEAPRVAKAQWEKANGALRLGEDALAKKQHDQAQSLLGDAAKAFREAEMAAISERATASVAGEAAQKREAQAAAQLGVAVAAARQEAERADGARLAGKMFADARDREREGKTAFDRRDFAGSERKYREAQQAYTVATQEAKKGGEAERQKAIDTERQKAVEAERQRLAESDRQRTAAIQKQQAELDPVREAVATARRAAEQVGAERLASERFSAAREREREATAAVGRQEYVQAIQALVRAEADYKSATQDALAARRRTATAPTPAAAVDSRNEIRALLTAFEQGVQKKDMDLLQRIGIKPDELKKMREILEQTKTYKVELKVEAIDVNGDDAQARGQRQDIAVSLTGKGFVKEAAFTFKLKRAASGTWVIDATN
jgi:serine/threonine protein kinase